MYFLKSDSEISYCVQKRVSLIIELQYMLINKLAIFNLNSFYALDFDNGLVNMDSAVLII